jgi:A/G-specific adenine glycosylase
MPNNHNSGCRFSPAEFQHALFNWYDIARRDLPWRAQPGSRSDPYGVWLSEIMLQQTTVKAVIPYFQKFMMKWPTPEALGAAPRDEVLAAWAGLGYYSRARNLHACAQRIAREGFPWTEAGLRMLPGIGAYTAAAIAAIAFDEPAAVVDGNVERVLTRIFALHTPLPSARPAIRELAASLTPAERPGDYAQAMMDLGATICTPRTPSCPVCPVRTFCAAAAIGEPQRFPVRLAKTGRPIRRGNAFVILRKEGNGLQVLLRRRKDKGLLGGMMEVPCTEWLVNATPKNGSAVEGKTLPQVTANATLTTSSNGGEWTEADTVQHTFTHFHLEMRIFAAEYTVVREAAAEFAGEWAALEKLAQFALPTVMKKAVFSGLEALGVQISASVPRGKAAKSASKVSTVERSARPSTKPGRK